MHYQEEKGEASKQIQHMCRTRVTCSRSECFKGYNLHAAFPYFASRRPLKCFRATTAPSMFKSIAADSQHTTADETVCVCVLVQGPCCALM